MNRIQPRSRPSARYDTRRSIRGFRYRSTDEQLSCDNTESVHTPFSGDLRAYSTTRHVNVSGGFGIRDSANNGITPRQIIAASGNQRTFFTWAHANNVEMICSPRTVRSVHDLFTSSSSISCVGVRGS